jgi:hypothetical protein
MSRTWYANVTQAVPALALSILPSTTITAGAETNATGSGCPAELTCELFRNDAGVTNSDIATLAAGTYNYIYNTTGNENYSSASVSSILTVNSGGGPGPGGCTDRTWDPDRSTVCEGVDFIQTSNCNHHRDAVGTKRADWNCTSYGECINGHSSRTCEDLNGCGTTSNRPDLTRRCDVDRCKPHYHCTAWNLCGYDVDANSLLSGIIRYTGQHERECFDTNNCAENMTEYENCTSGTYVDVQKENVCGKSVLTLINRASRVPVTRIDMSSWKASRLDVIFTQQKVKYCAYCYDGIMDFDETGIDCGGSCRACRPESRFPRWLIDGILILLALLLLIPLLKLAREDDDIIAEIRAMIASGTGALRAKDRQKAENNFRKIKWLYIQLESVRKKKMIMKEILKYHRTIKEFTEF